MNFDDVDDDEFRLLMTAPVDNLKKQSARAGVPAAKAGSKDTLAAMSDDDFVKAMGGPAKAAAKPLPPDAITAEELYALGSSPETLRAKLAPPVEQKKEPGFLDRMKADPGREVVNLIGGSFDKAADAATLGYYTKGRNALYDAISPKLAADTRAVDQEFSQQHPYVSSGASAVGYLTPYGAPSILAKGAGVIGNVAAKAVPRMLAQPVAGAATGALAAGTTAAGEAAVGGASPGETLDAGLHGAKYGALVGGGLGAVQGGVGKLAERADARVSRRNVSDFTEGASATRRDRVIGKGGEKYDRVDSLARRTPDLEAAAGDAAKQEPIVAREINRVGASLDEVYADAIARPSVIVDPMRQVAAEIRGRPHTGQEAEVATQLEKEADRVSETWAGFSKKGRGEARPVQPPSEYTEGTSVGVTPREPTVRMSHEDMRNLSYGRERIDHIEPPPTTGTSDTVLFDPANPRGGAVKRSITAPPAEQGYIDARAARQMITNYGKGLYGGNPNNVPSIPKAVRQEVYRRQTDALRDAVEHFKPGVSEELNAYNAEMSDWLNIHDAVKSRAARQQTPSMTLKGQSHEILDTALGILHPGHYLVKKGLEHVGPGALRGFDRELSTMGAPGAVMQEANPLLRAVDSERQKSRERAEFIRSAKLSKEQAAEEERQRAAREAFRQPYDIDPIN